MTPYLPSVPVITTLHSHHFPSPWPLRLGSQASAAIPKIIPHDKDSCVEAFIRWKPEAVSYSNTSEYTQVRKMRQIQNISTGKKVKAAIYFSLKESWLTNGCVWMADRGHAPDRILPNTAFTATRGLIHWSSSFTGSDRHGQKGYLAEGMPCSLKTHQTSCLKELNTLLKF